MLLNNTEGEKTPQVREKSGWYEDFKEFTTETTSHGIKYVFHAAYRWVRIVYLILYLMAVGYTMKIVIGSIVQYIEMETGTRIETLTLRQEEGMNQPAVTHPTVSLCPINTVSQSYLNKHEGLDQIMSAFRTFKPLIIDPSDPANVLKNNITKQHFNDINVTMDQWNKYKEMTYEEIIKHGKPRIGPMQCEHYIHKCHNENVLGDKWLQEEISLSGSCFRVNPEGALYTQAGDYGMLRLFMFADLADYSDVAKKDPQYGWIVTFHDNGTYSSTATSGFYMSPGNVYKADLSKIEEQNIGPPAGSCNPHHTTNAYGTYSENSCVAMCRDDYILEKCGCLQFTPPHPENVEEPDKYKKTCTLEQWLTCGQQAHKKFVDMFVDLEREGEPLCDCDKACKEIKYSATISSSQLSKYYAESKLPLLHMVNRQIAENEHRSLADLNMPGLPVNNNTYNLTTENVYENIMVLEVLFTSIQVSQIDEYVKFDFNGLIGNIGGQMGMLLGASAFTVIEFVHFLIKSCWRHCITKNSRRDTATVGYYRDDGI